MKLVFIYGPPASGKLTVASELSRLTGFKLFHNHVSIQFVQSIFDFGTRPFLRLLDKYRLDMLEEAAKNGVDTIFTFVYSKDAGDDLFVKQVIKKIEAHDGKVLFVRLHCERQELIRRVKLRQRRKMGKVSKAKRLNDMFRNYKLDFEIPHQKSLSIDTTKEHAKNSAKLIANHFNLKAAQTRDRGR